MTSESGTSVRSGPGSSRSDELIAVARIVKPQGRHGEVAAEILTDFPARFETLRRVFLEDLAGGSQSAEVERAWLHNGRVILKFAGVDSIGAAEPLRKRYVLIPRSERIQLPSGRYYIWELVGCRVVREHDGTRELGTISEVESTGGVDLLHVKAPDGELLIPLAESICTRIDVEKKMVVVEPPEDLLELNEPE